ncbi:MFS transporter [Kushneria pakistanensis]|uniref:MFS transporter n=1 Tax=Kushneria pakistanensis TaxID=1508770 RepID=A0ABQ3FLR9_9GAMM|nr:MFS transporter [Kushneria pakistanensis]GHC29643.1 MFS transporter [Kushneria pakistanensis]
MSRTSPPGSETSTMPGEEAPFIERGGPEYRPTMLALFLGAFSTFALLYCVQPMLPILSDAFGIDPASTSLVLSVSTGMLAVGLLMTGPVSDALGRKKMMSLALLSASALTIGAAFMQHWGAILVMRALAGLSMAGLCGVAMAYLNEEIHPSFIGVSMGLYIGGNAIGGMSGRLISGVMVDFVHWRVTLATMGIISLISAIAFMKMLPPSRHFVPRQLSVANLAGAFRLHFRDAGLPWLFLEAFLLMGSFVTLFNYIVYRLLEAPYHFSQTVIGLLSIVYLSGIYSSAWAGGLADRLGRPRTFWVFIVVMLAGLGLTLASPVIMIMIGMLIFTFGFFAAHSIASGWVGQRATQARGQASSLYLFSYYLGSSLAGTLGGAFWTMGGWNGVVAFITALLLIALLAGLRLRRLTEDIPG